MRRYWIGLIVLVACGRTRHGDGIGASGGDATGGGTDISEVSAGSPSEGPVGAEAGRSNNGGSTAAGGSGAGSGGQAGTSGGPTTAGEGGASLDPFECGPPYTGPVGGPREDGPAPFTAPCSAISDDTILERYDNFEARVPQGLYYEPPTANFNWGSSCASSFMELLSHAGPSAASLEGTAETAWFYEAQLCAPSGRRLYRELRCDYFDGMSFKSTDPEQRAFLASVLWWMQWGQSSDAALLGYSWQFGNATDWLETCWLQTVHADFGLCDQVSLMSSTSAFTYNGGPVRRTEPRVIRTLQGKCR